MSAKISKLISPAELEVMHVLWAQSPMAASDVAANLGDSQDWTSRTIKTLLARLVEKGALKTKADGRRFLYSPVITRKAYERSAARTLRDRLFGGRAAPLVAHLVEGETLSAAEIAELEAIIKSLKS